MSRIDEIRKEMVAAMKNKDKARKEALSMLLSALKMHRLIKERTSRRRKKIQLSQKR